MKYIKVALIICVNLALNANAQSDTVLIKNIGYVIENQVAFGDLLVFKTGFSFKSVSNDAIKFKQDFIALKKHTSNFKSNQIEFQDLASPVYTLEFESKKQIEFMDKMINGNKKKSFLSRKFAQRHIAELLNSYIRGLVN